MSALTLLSRVCAFHLGWDVDADSTASFATAYHQGIDLVVELHRGDVGGNHWFAEVGSAGCAFEAAGEGEVAVALGQALGAFLKAQAAIRDNEARPVRQRVTAGIRARTIERVIAELADDASAWGDEARAGEGDTCSALRRLLAAMVPTLGTSVVEALPQGIRERLVDLPGLALESVGLRQ